jgi:hypothetical protein
LKGWVTIETVKVIFMVFLGTILAVGVLGIVSALISSSRISKLEEFKEKD